MKSVGEDEARLALRRPKHRRKPTAFTRVHQEKDGVVRIKQILNGIDIRLGLLLRAWRDGMTRHRDGQRYSLGILKASLEQASAVM